MIDFKFDDLYKIIVNEAPIASYLRRPTSQAYRDKVAQDAVNAQKEAEAQQQQASAEKPQSFLSKLGSSASTAMKSVAPAAGEKIKDVAAGGLKMAGKAALGTAKAVGKAALNPRGTVKTAREFFLGDDPMGMVSKGVQNVRDKIKQSAGSNLEEFDKDVVKGLIAGQAPVKPGMKPDSQQTQTGTVQGAGQVTQGQVISGGLPGTSQADTSTGATTANITQRAALAKRDPKPGDIFTLPSDVDGRIKSYKVKKVKGGIVVAEPTMSK